MFQAVIDTPPSITDRWGDIYSTSSSTFAKACAGTGDTPVVESEGTSTAQTSYIGIYNAQQAFFTWDLSALPPDAVVQSASIQTWLSGIVVDRSWVAEMYVLDWGTTLSAGDFQTNSELTTKRNAGEMAGFINSADLVTSTWHTWDLTGAAAGVLVSSLQSAIGSSDRFQVVFATNKQRVVDAPGVVEADRINVGSTIAFNFPILTINYTSALLNGSGLLGVPM